jgi:hypothetical protein
MNARKKTAIIGLSLIVLAATVLPAQPAQRPITGAELDRFIRDWPRFKSRLEETGRTFESLDAAANLSYLMSGMNMDGYLSSIGWDTDRFFYVTGNVANALMILKAEAELPDVVIQLQTQRRELAVTPGLSEADRKAMLAQIDELIAQFQDFQFGYEVPASELELVRARKQQLFRLFEIEE